MKNKKNLLVVYSTARGTVTTKKCENMISDHGRGGVLLDCEHLVKYERVLAIFWDDTQIYEKPEFSYIRYSGGYASAIDRVLCGEF